MIGYNEFQAIVLAGGKGSRMTELTTDQPKCLLPIANVPMIWYPLQILERYGFKEAIIVVSDLIKSNVSTSLDKLDLKIKTEIIAIPEAEDLGTVDTLRFIHEKIYTDLLVISCDLIINVDISEALNLYRKHNASITALMLPVPEMPNDFVTPGPKNKQKPETDLIAVDNNTGRLIFMGSASDFEEMINMSHKLCKKYTNFTMNSKLMDAHLYVINKWVLDFLVYNKKFNTLKGELLPYIINKQLSKPKIVEDKNSVMQVELNEDIYHFARERPLDKMIRKMSAFNDHNTDLKEAYYGDIIRCYAYMPSNDVFGVRANTVQMYHLANAKVLEWWNADKKNSDQLSRLPSISSLATVRSTQMQECRVNDNALIEEKTSLKNSYIGCNSVVKSKTRISQSVIMKNVTINERCVIHNSILCNGCIIEEGAVLKNCLVGARYVIKSGNEHSREVLTNEDELIEF